MNEQYLWIGSEIDAINPYIHPLNGRVLVDVGCGAGKFSGWVASQGGIAIGIDLPEVITKIDRANTPMGVTFREGTAEKMPVDDGLADCLCFLASFHHIPLEKMDDAVGETLRVLKTHGLLIILEPVPMPGGYSELVALIEDESAIQGEAHRHIKSLRGKGFEELAEHFYFLDRTLDDFINLMINNVLDADRRAEILAKAHDLLLARHGNVEIDVAKHIVRSYARVNVFRKSI